LAVVVDVVFSRRGPALWLLHCYALGDKASFSTANYTFLNYLVLVPAFFCSTIEPALASARRSRHAPGGSPAGDRAAQEESLSILG